jgi:Flp pilus assembly protein TadB
MTIESEIAGLTTATGNLLGAVNVSKATLDEKVTVATEQAALATAAAAKDIGQIVQSANYTLTLTDGGKHIYHPAADTTGRTWAIPANASVAFAVGTAITLVNATGAGLVTLAITSDTMYLSGSGETGSRLLEASGIATLLKVGPTLWIISGVGLS